MKRKIEKVSLKSSIDLKNKLLLWAQQFDEVVWLDSNNSSQLKNNKYDSFEFILAVDAEKKIDSNYSNAFETLKSFQAHTKDYLFGYLAYALKNDIETLNSNNFDGLEFADIHFFQPKKIFFYTNNTLKMCYLNKYSDELKRDLSQILNSSLTTGESDSSINQGEIKISSRISKESYFNKLEHILEHIHRGDIYEVNFCQEFYSSNSIIDPLSVYKKLNFISSPPFASFLKTKDKYLLSASPERFVKKQGNQVISQPIKGTARRHVLSKEDEKIAQQLKIDEKERAENIMIVDLVRNDLSKTAKKGSIQVEELCEVHTFKQVHQLISTITSEVDSKINSIDIIKSLFPMGSMTGAPKISAMKIIEEEEETKRGLYSGAVGYFTPQNDFDFNVVIRSILYNKTKKYISFSVGGAITAQSIPENEYQECLLKAMAMKKALQR